jgi:hypothetical protein
MQADGTAQRGASGELHMRKAGGGRSFISQRTLQHRGIPKTYVRLPCL